jgi:hypothetical protein
MRLSCAWLAISFLVGASVAISSPQTATISIPAWVDGGDCANPPQFEATLNNKPATVVAQLDPASDQMILVVFDLTGDLSIIEAAKQAVAADIAKLPKNARVGLLRAQDGLHVLADPSADHEQLTGVIQSLSPSGVPGLLGAVPSALALGDAILRKSAVRVSVLLVTDGSIYGYREDYTNPVINESDPHDLSRRMPGALIEEAFSKLKDPAGSLQAPLFIVHLNYRQDRLNVVYQNGLDTLASSTGGMVGFCRSQAEIPKVIAAMFTRISSAWRLNLAVPENLPNNIQIRLSAPCSEGERHLSWRARLYAKEG